MAKTEIFASVSSLASMLSDEQFESHMIEAINAKETDRRNAIVISQDLGRIFGEKMFSWPVPDSRAEDGTNNPAIVEDRIENRKVDVNFYWELYDGSPMGLAQTTMIENLKKAKAGDATAPAELQGKGKDTYTSLIATWTQRRQYGRANMVKAAKVIFQCWSIDEHCPNVGVLFMKEDNEGVEEYSRSTKPIRLFERTEGGGGESTVISVGTFLALDAEVAKSKGGSFAELLKTSAREPRKDIKGITINTFEEMDDGAAAFASYLVGIDGNKKAKINFLSKLNGAGTDDLILSLNTIAWELDKYLSLPAIQKRLMELEANPRESEAANG